MARQFLSGIDGAGIPFLRLRLENLGAAPTALGAGHAYFDTAQGYPFFYTGSAFQTPFARSAHTGTQPSSTISDLGTVVKGYALNSFAAPTGPVAMGGNKITGLADPTNAQDAVTLNWATGQIQSAAAGISSKDPVRAVATANVSSLSGTMTVDGVALAAGDRVLLTGQTTGSQNGPWVVASGAWARPSTEGATYELDKGAVWLVTEGTSYGGTQWRCNNTGTITPGTTNISIVQFAASASVSTGNGLQQVSGVISVQLQSASGLVATGSGLAVDTTVVARKFSATIGDGSATSYTVNHGLGTRDVQVQVYATASPYGTVEADVNRTDANNVAVVFAMAPASGAYRVVVLG